MTQTDMERDKRPRRPDVLKKLNKESLYLIERGLLGDLPERFKPPPIVPVRGRPTDVVVAKPAGLLSSCLPVIPDSPGSEKHTSSEEDNVSPLKKSFSFRDKFSRISFLGKKDKPKWNTIVENVRDETKHGDAMDKRDDECEYKSNKRFWFFRNKEIEKRDRNTPIYKRSKSFEFLPRAIEEEDEDNEHYKLHKNQSCVFGSTDTMGEAWTSNESLEYVSSVYYDKEDGVFLKSIKEFPASESSNNNSSMSTVTSASSGIVANIFKTESVQNLLDEFDKAVDMFSETYLSDCEPYTKSNKEMNVKEKRKSSSFSTLPSPKVVQVNKVSEISEDFKKELSLVVSAKRVSGKTARRGSVTDWFVLEDQEASEGKEANRYKRGQKKSMNRVRRMSSTKYWITPEECAVYTREQRPPLVIPRITQYRTPRREPRQFVPYAEENLPEASLKARQYDREQNWSPTSERGRVDIERSFSKAAESPHFARINKRFGGSTENLLAAPRRPNNLLLPPSSSGDSLDVEMREREVGYARSRKSRSMVAPKHRMRSPVPAPRMLLAGEEPVLMEGPVRRTRFWGGGKKTKKNWTDCYMALTATALKFYKDQKTYQASRMQKSGTSGTPPSPNGARPELVLALRNAHVIHCIPVHTRRHSKSLVVTVDHDQYLIQDETEEGAKRWLQCIMSVIYSLYPRLGELPRAPSPSSAADLESLGRTPPTARHYRPKQKAGGSSNEDLSDSTELSIQKSQVRSRLRKFFAKRPAMDVLVKKGYYKDEPVFGRNLEEVCSTTSPRVPGFVVACVTEIESSEDNMTTDGLYRASGNLSQVQKIRLEIDQNNMSVIANNTDIHVLTGSLKLFFRELKEPLIPCSMFDRILAACSIKPKEAKIKEFRDIVNALPQCNRDTLKYLLEHLLRVTQYSERNRMHTANLAIVFGPTLLWAPAEQAHNIAVDCIQQNNVVEILLNEFKDIFADDKGKKKA